MAVGWMVVVMKGLSFSSGLLVDQHGREFRLANDPVPDIGLAAEFEEFAAVSYHLDRHAHRIAGADGAAEAYRIDRGKENSLVFNIDFQRFRHQYAAGLGDRLDQQYAR